MQFVRWSKLKAHVFANYLQDAFGSYKFCKKRSCGVFVNKIEVTQPFTASATLEKKKHNLKLAADRIRKYVIRPGEVFSFWRAVGNPNTKQFAASRGIRGGVLQLERGGGLCQASGIIYHLALIAGLQIIERYNHSKDLYTEETRFCPLGSDATVAYGYRDLRIKNNTDTLINFSLEVCDNHFTGYLFSKEPIQKHEIHFEYQVKNDNLLEAVTIDKTCGEILTTSIYERLEQ